MPQVIPSIDRSVCVYVYAIKMSKFILHVLSHPYNNNNNK